MIKLSISNFNLNNLITSNFSVKVTINSSKIETYSLLGNVKKTFLKFQLIFGDFIESIHANCYNIH